MGAGIAVQASYFIAAALFILGLKRMSSPVTARSGIVWAGVGMVVATLITFLTPAIKNGELTIDWQDEVFAQSALTHDGEVRHAATAKLLEGR